LTSAAKAELTAQEKSEIAKREGNDMAKDLRVFIGFECDCELRGGVGKADNVSVKKCQRRDIQSNFTFILEICKKIVAPVTPTTNDKLAFSGVACFRKYASALPRGGSGMALEGVVGVYNMLK
jgi:hypothetical protein